MKTLLVSTLWLATVLSVYAQTAISDAAAASGAKVGTGESPGINAPSTIGPRDGAENPANGAIVTPPPGITPTPPSAPNAGTGPNSPTSPTPPGTGTGTDGAGTGR